MGREKEERGMKEEGEASAMTIDETWVAIAVNVDRTVSASRSSAFIPATSLSILLMYSRTAVMTLMAGGAEVAAASWNRTCWSWNERRAPSKNAAGSSRLRARWRPAAPKQTRQFAGCGRTALTPAMSAAALPDAKRQKTGASAGPTLSHDTSRIHVAVRPESYAAELDAKVAVVRSKFAAAQLALPAHIDVHASQHAGFRQRAEFGVWRHDVDGAERLETCMFAKNKGGPVRVASFPMGSARMNQLMGEVLAFCHDPVRREIMCPGLFTVKFLTTLSGEALVTLIYHRAFSLDMWRREAAAMIAALNLVGVVGRSRGFKDTVGRGDWVIERLRVHGRTLEYKQMEELFGQSNGGIAEKMLSWAVDAAQSSDSPALDGGAAASAGAEAAVRSDDLLELYCGSGAFTAALATSFRRVFATELSKGAIDVSGENMQRNAVTNVEFGRVSAEDLRLAFEGVRPFRRLAHVDLLSYEFNTIVVDPPRAGCGADVSAFLARFPRIIYISCNPTTMCEDIARLNVTHRIARFAVFDQFPYTDHCECGALLVKRDGLDAANVRAVPCAAAVATTADVAAETGAGDDAASPAAE